MEGWSKIEFIYCHKLHISPIDLRELEFYTIEYILKQYEEYIDKENKEYEKQQKEMEKQQRSMSTPNFTLPKYEFPKFNMPDIPK